MASDAERQEFDGWTGDDISSQEDANKLQRAFEYYRQEGIYSTAQAVENRLALLTKAQHSSNDVGAEEEVHCTLASFQEECKRKATAKQQARDRDAITQLQPPVRSSLRPTNKLPAPVAPAPGKTHGKGKNVSHSQDLTDQHLPAADEPLGGAPLNISSSSSGSRPAAINNMPGLIRGSKAPQQQQQQQQQGSGPTTLVQEVPVRGAKRTQQLIQQNQVLPSADKAALADAERAKGNEHFKAGNVADAVECYSVSIGLDPQQLAAYTNRAQAYLSLKQWEYAVTDCDSALTIIQRSEAEGVTGLDAFRHKARVRRAKAFDGMGQTDRALQEYEQLLQTAPDDVTLQNLRAKARKALARRTPSAAGASPAARAPAAAAAAAGPKPSARRIPVVEASDDDEDEVADGVDNQSGSRQQQQQQQQEVVARDVAPKGQQEQQKKPSSAGVSSRQQAAQQTRRLPIAVTCTSSDEDEDDKEEEKAQKVQQQVAAPVTQQQQPKQQESDASAQNPPAQQPPAATTAAAAAARAPASSSGATPGAAAGAVARAPQPAVAASGSGGPESKSSSSTSGGRSSGGSSDDEASAEGSESDQDEQEQDSWPGAASAAVAAPQLLDYDQLHDRLVEAGNMSFKQGHDAAALKAYTKAIQHAPNSVRALVNAALTLQRSSSSSSSSSQGKAAQVHEYTTLAVGLDPTHAKAYYVRHKAKVALGDLKGAEADLLTVVKLEQRQQQYRSELAALQDRISSSMQAARVSADRARRASTTVAESCTIEEVVEDPAEEMQRVYDSLKAQERMLLGRARKLPQQAQALRTAFNTDLQQQLQAWQQQQQQQQRRKVKAHRNSNSAWDELVQKRQARLSHRSTGAAAAAAVNRSPSQQQPAAASPHDGDDGDDGEDGGSSHYSSCISGSSRKSSMSLSETFGSPAAPSPAPPAPAAATHTAASDSAASAGSNGPPTPPAAAAATTQAAGTPAAAAFSTTPLSAAQPSAAAAAGGRAGGAGAMPGVLPAAAAAAALQAASDQGLLTQGLLQRPASSSAAAAAAAAADDTPGPSTPRSSRATAPTPANTPAPAAAACSAAPPATQQQQQQQGGDGSSSRPGAQPPQQQQQQRPHYVSAADARSNIASQVEQLRLLGNQMMQEGRVEGAKEVYMEALQLDTNNIKVLSNLAALYLKQRDGANALRSCNEVLEQQQDSSPDLTPEMWRKALLRRGLAYEQLGHYSEAVADLGAVKESQPAGCVEPQLDSDLLRVSQLLQQQRQQQQQQQQQQQAAAAAAAAAPRAPAPAAKPDGRVEILDDDDDDADDQGSSSSAQEVSESLRDEDELASQQQQQQSVAASPALTWDPYKPYAGDADALQQQQQQQGVPEDVTAEQEEQATLEEAWAAPSAVFQHTNSSTSSSNMNGTTARPWVSGDPSAAGQQRGHHQASAKQQPAYSWQQHVESDDDGDDEADEEERQQHRQGEGRGAAAAAASSSSISNLLGADSSSGLFGARGGRRGGPAAAAAGITSDNPLFVEDDNAWDDDFGGGMDTDFDVDLLAGSSTHYDEDWHKRLNHTAQAAKAQHDAALRRQQQQQQQQGGNKLNRDAAGAGAGADDMRAKIQKLQEQLANRQRWGQHEALTKSGDREKGNAAFAQGQWDSALRFFNAAITADATDVRALANRAEVFKKLRRPAKVEEDCSSALALLRRPGGRCSSIDGDVGAARELRCRLLMRRAMALKEQDKFKEALADTKELQGLKPGEASVQKLHTELSEAYRQQLQRLVLQASQQEQQQAAAGADGSSADTVTTAAAAAAEEKAPIVRLHRIIIEETDGSDSDEDEEEKEEGRLGDSSDHAAAAAGTTTGNNNSSASTSSSCNGGGGGERRQPAAPAAVPAAASGTVPSVQQQRVLAAPKTSQEFVTTAKSLLAPAATAAAASTAIKSKGGAATTTSSSSTRAQQQQQQLGQYVKLLEPSRYPAVFKASLGKEVLPLLLQGLQEVAAEDPGFAADGLSALSSVPRFGIVWAMADKGTKALLQEVVGKVAASGRDVAALRKSYGLKQAA